MIINRDLTVELSPREVADEIWDMDSVEQASLLNNLADIYQTYFPQFCMQLEYVRCELEDDYNKAERICIVNMLKEMLDYFDYEETNQDVCKGGEDE